MILPEGVWHACLSYAGAAVNNKYLSDRDLEQTMELSDEDAAFFYDKAPSVRRSREGQKKRTETHSVLSWISMDGSFLPHPTSLSDTIPDHHS